MNRKEAVAEVDKLFGPMFFAYCLDRLDCREYQIRTRQEHPQYEEHPVVGKSGVSWEVALLDAQCVVREFKLYHSSAIPMRVEYFELDDSADLIARIKAKMRSEWGQW